MAAVSPLPDDYVTEWLDELDRLMAAAAFSPAARAAVVAVIDAFAAEDGGLPRAALEVRRMLTATPAEAYPSDGPTPARARSEACGFTRELPMQPVAAHASAA